MKEYPETHQYGLVTVENLDLIAKGLSGNPYSFGLEGDFGVQIAEDGRVWINVNGIALIRFKPTEKSEQPMCHNYLG